MDVEKMRFNKENVDEIIKIPTYYKGSLRNFTAFLLETATLEDMEEALKRLQEREEQKYKKEILQSEIKRRSKEEPDIKEKARVFGKENIKAWQEMMEFWKNAKSTRTQKMIIQKGKYITWIIHTRKKKERKW